MLILIRIFILSCIMFTVHLQQAVAQKFIKNSEEKMYLAWTLDTRIDPITDEKTYTLGTGSEKGDFIFFQCNKELTVFGFKPCDFCFEISDTRNVSYRFDNDAAVTEKWFNSKDTALMVQGIESFENRILAAHKFVIRTGETTTFVPLDNMAKMLSEFQQKCSALK